MDNTTLDSDENFKEAILNDIIYHNKNSNYIAMH